MHILQGGNNYHVTGGSDRVMIETAKLLEKYGQNVIPFSPDKEGNYNTPWDKYFPSAFDNKQAGLLDVPRYLFSSSARKNISQLIKEHKVDIAHLHIYNGGLTTSILKPLRKKGIPIVQSLHEYRLACPVYTMVSHGKVCEACEGHKYYRALPKKCNKGSLTKTGVSVLEAYYSKAMGAHDLDHYIAVSFFMKNKMLEYGIGEGRITALHNFVDPEHYKPNFNVGGYFLFFGRIERLKGVFTMLEAASKDDFPLVFVGDGADYDLLKDRAKKYSLKNVQFMDFLNGEALHNMIRNSIATVLPSEWYENCPMTVLESLALGKPVIGANIGGIPELIEDEKDGFIFPSGDAVSLRDKMDFLLKNPRKAEAMGKNGRQKILNQFGPERHYEKLMKLYKSIIGKKA